MSQSPRRLATALLTLVAVLSLAACGSGSSGGSAESGDVKTGPGVDAGAKTIKIGNLTALTGPIAVLGKSLTDSYDAYISDLNKRGGIDGWKLELVTRDTGSVPADHVRSFNEIRGNIALLSSIGSPPTKAIQEAVDKEKLVTQPTSFNTVWGLDPVMAPLATPYAIEVMNLVDHQVKENGAESKKFAIVYQNDEFGKDGLRGYDAVTKNLGLNSVAKVPYKLEDTDFTPQVQRLRAAGAETVMCACAPGALASTVGTAASQGYKPTWLAQGLGFTPLIMSKDGTREAKKTPVAGALAADTYTAAFATPVGELPDAAGFERLREVTKSFAPDEKKLLPYHVTGYAMARVAEAILRKAIENGDLTREGIFKAKNELGTVDLEGLASDVTYDGRPSPPSRDSAIAKMTLSKDGFLEVLNESYTSDTAKEFDITTIED